MGAILIQIPRSSLELLSCGAFIWLLTNPWPRLVSNSAMDIITVLRVNAVNTAEAWVQKSLSGTEE